jgi:hypothetical protein
LERTWNGQLRADAGEAHLAFVEWLRSAEGQGLLGRSLLTGYSLDERDGRLTVRLAADQPPAIIRFLRNPRFWPDYWQFTSADPSLAVSAEESRLVTWRRSDHAPAGVCRAPT